MAKYRIMAFDGGGIRGALTVRILNRLNLRYTNIFKKTKLFAGTSTGSLIALGLAAGISIKHLDKLYSSKKASTIFELKNNGLIYPRYSLNNLKNILKTIFPLNLKLKDLKNDVVITSFKLAKCQKRKKGWCPVIFTNLPGSPNKESRVVDVALSSCAAPIYFPSYRKYIDGGVIANNPGAVALSYAIARVRRISQISLLSLGTGYYPREIEGDTRHWGALQWLLVSDPVLPLVTLLLDGASRKDCLIASNILGERYYRLNPVLDKPIGLDEYKKIPRLKQIGNSITLKPVSIWFKKQRWV